MGESVEGEQLYEKISQLRGEIVKLKEERDALIEQARKLRAEKFQKLENLRTLRETIDKIRET